MSLERRKPREIPRLLVSWPDETSFSSVQEEPSDWFDCQLIHTAVARSFPTLHQERSLQRLLCSSYGDRATSASLNLFLVPLRAAYTSGVLIRYSLTRADSLWNCTND